MSQVIVNPITNDITVIVEYSGGGSAVWGDIDGQPAYVASGDTVEDVREQLDIDNVDNTSDADKPISDATAGALALKADKTELFSGDYDDLDNKPTIPPVPAIMPQAEAEAGTSTTQRTISAQRLAQAIEALAPVSELTSVPVTGITNPVGGSYVVGRNSGTAGNPSVAVPMSNSGTAGLSVVQRNSAGGVIARSFIYEQETQSGTVLSFAGGCTKIDSISANKTYTFSNGINGASMVLQVTNTSGSDVTCSFTGASLAEGSDGVVKAGTFAWFTFAQVGGNIGGTKIQF